MRRGKEIAQGSHASMEFIVARLRHMNHVRVATIELDQEEQTWIGEGMAKVCLQVASEQELLDCHQTALNRNLRSHLIRDSGRTEFGGTPTLTACAIGPNESTEIDAVTGGLDLY